MMSRRGHLLALGLMIVLAGCGTSSGSQFGSLANEGTALLSEHGTKAPTPLADMPTGTATYRGVAAYSTTSSSPEDIIVDATSLSRIEIVANFAGGALEGRAYHFQSYDSNIDIVGELRLANGSITGNGFNADIGGNLTETGYGATVVGQYIGSLTGEFVGDNAEALIGTGAATGDYGAFGKIPVNAFFGAVR